MKIFYDATLAFSSSLHVTSNYFFHKLCEIQNTLNKWIESDDDVQKKMTTTMKVKFEEYWDVNGNLNYLLFVAAFLDPGTSWNTSTFVLVKCMIMRSAKVYQKN